MWKRQVCALIILTGTNILGGLFGLFIGLWWGKAFTFFIWTSFFIQALAVAPKRGGKVTFLARETGETLEEGLSILPLRGILFDAAGAVDPSKKLLRFLRKARNYVTIFCCIIAVVQIFAHHIPSQTTRPSVLPPAISVSPGEVRTFSVPAKSLGPIVFVKGLWVLDSLSAIVIVLEDGRRIFYSPGDRIDVGRHRGAFRVLNTSRTETVEVSIFSLKR